MHQTPRPTKNLRDGRTLCEHGVPLVEDCQRCDEAARRARLQRIRDEAEELSHRVVPK
jgi:hypothetical protein